MARDAQNHNVSSAAHTSGDKTLEEEGRYRRGENVHPRHQGSQWLVFCVLFADKDGFDINSSSLMIISVASVLFQTHLGGQAPSP